jgi:hypothetical protein
MDWHFFGVRRHDAALRFKERGFYATSALLNNKAASCRRTPKKALNTTPEFGRRTLTEDEITILDERVSGVGYEASMKGKSHYEARKTFGTRVAL